VRGEAGVSKVLDILRADRVLAVRLVGAASTSHVDRSLLARPFR
jgi:isopentenyl diphosphate isomerase/L-lactate dehydrogenase-like FMN-dependent dehydrogenase